jgi:antitoxin (DNA-binding transcriptional repressor) of toxin-antitoxin stability system
MIKPNYPFLSQDRSRNREAKTMRKVNLIEASQHLSELIEAAISGEEVMITKDDQPVVQLTPLQLVKPRRQPGSAKGMVTISDDFDEPLEDFKDYM